MIRRAQSSDIPALVALQQEVEAADALWGYGTDAPAEWATRDLAWTLVAVDGARSVGFIYGSPRLHAGECVFPAGSRILEIVEIIVTARERDRGLGRELVTALKQLALAQGFTHMRVYSAAKRFDEVVKFYRSCGFTPWFLEMTQELRDEHPG